MTEISAGDTTHTPPTLHTLNAIGSHNALRAQPVAAPTLEEALATPTAKALLHSDSYLNGETRLAWIDFPASHPERFETQLAETYLPLATHATEAPDYCDAGTIISTILHAKADRDSDWLRWRPHAYEKTMANFAPRALEQLDLRYVRSWLPGFLHRDRAHPPIPVARTDVIRMLAATLQSTILNS